VANGISCTGTFVVPEDVFTDTFTLAGPSTITVQTYGFGGGTNAAGTVISPGGFDSLVAFFSGPANNATLLTYSNSNPIASADDLSTFSPGCPPAGLVNVLGVPTCGDNLVTASLGPGTYTLLLTDAFNLPLSVDPGLPGALNLTNSSDYLDLTLGVFQTCLVYPVTCTPDNGNFAADILATTPGTPAPTPTGPPSVTATPEPGELVVLSLMFAILVSARLWVRRGAGGHGA
jgi:hypothetical protein